MNAPRFRYLVFLLALGWAVPVFGAPPAISLQTVSSGQLVSPVYLTTAGDGSNRLFVCDQVGQIRIIQDGMLLPTPFLDLSAKLVPQVSTYDETGLLNIAFHPGFSDPDSPGYQKFYVFYSAASPNVVGTSFISAITAGNPCTITAPAPHGLSTGDIVAITGVTGGTFSPAIDATGTPLAPTYAVTVIDAYNYTVPVNCSSTTSLKVTSAQVYSTQPVYCRSTISEFSISASNVNVADPTTERVVIAYDKPQDNHNGSQLGFGPDGYLYFSAGDGGSQDDNDYGHTGGYANAPVQSGNLGNAQDTTKLFGKVLRIDPLGNNGPVGADGIPGDPPSYGIPSDNPFAGQGGGVRQEIYTYGMRNPWRFCWDNDPSLGERMIEADVGQNNVEEINLLVSGGNYGWRVYEGTYGHDLTVLNNYPNLGPFIDPVAQYFHPTATTGFPVVFPKLGTSIIGGYVYRGSALPGLVGQYVFGDYSALGVGTSTGVLMTVDSSTWAISQSSLIGTLPIYLTSFGVDEQGEMYVLGKLAEGPADSTTTHLPTGAIYKIVPAQVGQVNFATLTPSQDNSLFAESPTFSDAQGYLYAGENSTSNVRRGLLEFNVAGQLPAGAVVTSAQLMLNMNSTAATTSARMSLFKLNDSWGQGTSGPSSGAGSPATENDATWADRFFDPSTPTLWTTAGGDHVSTASVTNSAVGTVAGYYTWNPGTQMLADIQGWLNTPSTNFGWLLEGAETTKNSVRRFDSMTSSAGVQPTLQITYVTSGEPTWRESWLQTYFGPPGTYVNDTADPSHDGLNNLLDYAYGYSPLVANLGYSPTVTNPSAAGTQTSLTTSESNNVFTTTFLCDPRATDLTYLLQSSSDLVTWTTIVQVTGGGTPTGSAYVSEAPNGGGPVQVVTAVETLPLPAKHFVKLLVTRTYQP